ncbi:MAG: hypothetical protein AAFQ20_03485 [Bacteroidota bacterium]
MDGFDKYGPEGVRVIGVPGMGAVAMVDAQALPPCVGNDVGHVQGHVPSTGMGSDGLEQSRSVVTVLNHRYPSIGPTVVFAHGTVKRIQGGLPEVDFRFYFWT